MVTGVVDAVGLAIVRDLGRVGVPVVALGCHRDATALLSRYCRAAVCADPHHEEERFVAGLVELGERLGGDAVLFAAADDFVHAIARHRERLAACYAVPMLDWPRMRRLADKRLQLELADEAGVDAPRTAVLCSPQDLEAAVADVPFPAVLKPAVPMALRRRTGQKAVRVARPQELAEAYRTARFAGDLLLQEVVPGPDDEVFIAGTYHDEAGRPLAVFTGRKLRQHPKGFGDTRAGESRRWPELEEVTLRLLAALPYHGISDVEFKRDARDGRLKLMEINAREGLWGPLARVAGVNLAAAAYRDAVGQPVGDLRQTDGVRWVDMVHDAPDSLGEVARGELGAVAWLASLRGVRADCLLSLHDPVPAAVEIGRMAGRRGARLARAALVR